VLRDEQTLIKLKEITVITGESVAVVSRDSFGRPKAKCLEL